MGQELRTGGGRTATPLLGWVLISVSWLAVMANQVIAPVLPRMHAHYSGTPHVDVLIAAAATIPALFIAGLAWLFGILGDRVGHKRVLFASTLLYGIVGTAPVWLETLRSIVVSRALVGVAEAGIMTCSTALIIAHFAGESRGRYFALQTGSAPVVAIIVTLIGGALGAASWRNPFYLYGFAFLLIPLTAFLVWEPSHARAPGRGGSGTGASAPASPAFRWGVLAWRCTVSAFGMAAFLVTAIQTSFLLTERGLESPAAIGNWMACSMLANPLGALAFGLLAWRMVPKLAISFALLAAGHFIMAMASHWESTVAGATVANLGAGMILPTMITWALADVPEDLRGRCTGLWMSAAFLGQFLSPQSIVGLKLLMGSLGGAVLVYALVCTVAAVLSAVGAVRARSPVPGG
ncbi:MAG: MFS transporter [Gammaproteobacteria bacterium]|nr:MFS transporter [Gammaproteobacteria bacterium]